MSPFPQNKGMVRVAYSLLLPATAHAQCWHEAKGEE